MKRNVKSTLGTRRAVPMARFDRLPPELRAIARHARGVRQGRSFPASDDEGTVIRCAVAHAWSESLPPILRWLQR
jgi:hypothetical protein